MKSTGLLLHRPPYRDAAVREWLDAAMVLAAFGQQVSVVLTDDAVWALQRDQDGSVIGDKTVGKLVAALEMYDVHAVIADADSLTARGLGADDLIGAVRVLPRPDWQAALADCAVLLSD